MLPLNIPHNEAILIPNHYSKRAASLNGYLTEKSNNVEEQTCGGEEDTSFTTGEDYATPCTITQYNTSVKKDIRKHDLTLKHPPPLFRPKLSDLNHEINHKIDTDRESQIAWSEEDSVHTDWSESNVWSDEDEDGLDGGKESHLL